ncbi:MAG: AraC-type DNA-binding protein [Schlesneria sp.]|nr:AraC-type DNA-binding protein [Schlesneria sp.]
MKPAFEKLLTPVGQSFRCFDRQTLSVAARWHRHPELELTYVEHGSGTRIVGDSIASYGDHDLVLVGEDLPHTWQSDDFRGRKLDLHPAIVIQFRHDFLGNDLFASPEFANVREMFDAARRGLQFPPEFAKRLGQSLSDLNKGSPARRLVSLLECLVELAECPDPQPLASASYGLATEDLSSSRIEKVCGLIGERYRNANLTHQELAKLAGMNGSAFSRFFRQATGKTVMDYLAELRISLACRMLIQTETPVTEIFDAVGFNSPSSFARRFRQLREMSPREYRQAHRAAVGNSVQ